jgi:hypothetical protein
VRPKRSKTTALRTIVSAVCPFLIGLGIGSVGELVPFWYGVGLIVICTIPLAIYHWLNKNRILAVLMMIGLIVFSVLLYRSEAPMIIQAISLPGPDFGGLKRAGIEWNQAYAETVVELTNSLSHDYHDLDIQIGTSDTIFQVGETSNLKCVSLNGEQFLAIHRVRCPLLPGGATIQLAVITVILNQQQGTMPKNLFLPPKPPSSVTVRVDYNRGKRSYSAESSGDSRREQNRTK